MGTSRTSGSKRTLPMFVTVTLPAAGSPATTRCGSSSMVTDTFVRPRPSSAEHEQDDPSESNDAQLHPPEP